MAVHEVGWVEDGNQPADDRILVGKPEGKRPLGRPGVDERVILD
jgi:hypothetical protein